MISFPLVCANSKREDLTALRVPFVLMRLCGLCSFHEILFDGQHLGLLSARSLSLSRSSSSSFYTESFSSPSYNPTLFAHHVPPRHPARLPSHQQDRPDEVDEVRTSLVLAFRRRQGYWRVEQALEHLLARYRARKETGKVQFRTSNRLLIPSPHRFSSPSPHFRHSNRSRALLPPSPPHAQPPPSSHRIFAIFSSTLSLLFPLFPPSNSSR
jgi:hypothetical protein